MRLRNKIGQLVNNYPFLYRPALALNGIFLMLFPKIASARRGGKTASAEYCYEVFLYHLTKAFDKGMKTAPRYVAEFGPGNSIGAGLCFLLAGAKEYYAFDAVSHAELGKNIEVFNKLVTYFRDRRSFNIPFPKHILTDEILERSLSDFRVDFIRNLLNASAPSSLQNDDEVTISYIAPWDCYTGDFPDVDFVFSQAVLEHIDDLDMVYSTMAKITCKYEGWLSHRIDFRSHLRGIRWNEQWSFSEKVWKIIRGGRVYLINREPLSTHLRLLEKYNFDILDKEIILTDAPSIKRHQLKGKFKNMSDADFAARGCSILAKPKL